MEGEERIVGGGEWRKERRVEGGRKRKEGGGRRKEGGSRRE